MVAARDPHTFAWDRRQCARRVIKVLGESPGFPVTASVRILLLLDASSALATGIGC